MASHLAYPVGAHFGAEFALGSSRASRATPFPYHPRGQARAGRYINRGLDGGTVLSRTFQLHRAGRVRPGLPHAVVGDRIYASPAGTLARSSSVAGALPSAFSGVGDLVAAYREADGTVVRLTFARAENLLAGSDYNAFETEVVNRANLRPAGAGSLL